MSSQRSLWYRWWVKSGLTTPTLIAILKNTLPMTAALWVIQSTKLGQEFDSVGFLPIIITILMVPSQPRIPYLRLLINTLFLNAIVFCVGLLAGYCSTQARLHTTPPGASLNDYNSSAAAVAGIWLLFTIWALQTFRTFNPHQAKPVILCTIFTNVSLINCAKLRDMDEVISFNVQTLEMFLLGYAFSAFSSFFIFPHGSRDASMDDVAKMFDHTVNATSLEHAFGDLAAQDLSSASATSTAAEHIKALSRTFAKFEIDMSDAKKDIGWSRFSPADLNEVVQQFRSFIIPLRGLFAVESIRTTLYFGDHATHFDRDNALQDSDNVNAKERWDLMFEKLQHPMSQLHRLTEDAINHCRITLKIPGSATTSQDEMTNGHKAEDTESEKTSRALPGGAEFVASFKRQISEQRDALRVVIRLLKESDGRLGSVDNVADGRPSGKPHSPTAPQGRLLFTLYIEHLYNALLEALLDMVIFFDDRHVNSTPRLQLPGKKRLFKLLHRLIDHQHIEADMDDLTSEIPNLTLSRSRAPEPRLTKNLDRIRHQLAESLQRPGHIIGSAQSFFGLRVACAVMSIAIVAYLHRTQQWFFNQRGIWAAIWIPFSMAPSSGEAKSMLLYRVFGSLLSIPLSLVTWYIVDGVPAGVIVFFFVFAAVQQYFLVRFSQYGSFWRPCVITYSIIVGFSLQDKYSHVPQPPASVEHDYPIYLIGPYRCLCTLVGVGVAYFWTVFPQPTTANSVMRRRLGQALFGLVEYQSCMHWAVSSWAGGQQGDAHDKSSIAYRLLKARHQLFVKETAVLTVIRDQHRFAGFDIPLFGIGSGPEHRYVAIADEVDRVISYLNVVIYVAAHFHTHLLHSNRHAEKNAWSSGVTDLLSICRETAARLTSLIHILASSITNDQPLPPFLHAPEPFVVARRMRDLRPDLMDVVHADEEGYKAFAAIEVSVAMASKSLEQILGVVRELVGEVGVGFDVDLSGLDENESEKEKTK